MVQLKTLITLYFTFTLRFLSFILGQTSQGTIIFFLFFVVQRTPWHCSSATSPLPEVQEHFPHCSPCSVKQHKISFSSGYRSHSEVPRARVPAKPCQLLQRQNSPLQPQKDQQTYTFLIRSHFQITMTPWNTVCFLLSFYNTKDFF